MWLFILIIVRLWVSFIHSLQFLLVFSRDYHMTLFLFVLGFDMVLYFKNNFLETVFKLIAKSGFSFVD